MNKFQELQKEALIELLLEATRELREAIAKKSSPAEIAYRQQEVQLIQNAIFNKGTHKRKA